MTPAGLSLTGTVPTQRPVIGQPQDDEPWIDSYHVRNGCRLKGPRCALAYAKRNHPAVKG